MQRPLSLQTAEAYPSSTLPEFTVKAKDDGVGADLGGRRRLGQSRTPAFAKSCRLRKPAGMAGKSHALSFRRAEVRVNVQRVPMS